MRTPISFPSDLHARIESSASLEYCIRQTLSAANNLIGTRFVLRRKHAVGGPAPVLEGVVICVQCRAPQFDVRRLHHYHGCSVGEMQSWAAQLEELLERQVSAPPQTVAISLAGGCAR